MLEKRVKLRCPLLVSVSRILHESSSLRVSVHHTCSFFGVYITKLPSFWRMSRAPVLRAVFVCQMADPL
ncbi:hypothetical protein CRUP_022347 [Coryphaenoides rupestris]|nr:hypothetical protein CRUP_022347 [Coryphaenoides rupestris]